MTSKRRDWKSKPYDKKPEPEPEPMPPAPVEDDEPGLD